MEAKIVDLRYRMKDVLKALDKNEEVKVLYHGKLKGIIVPAKKDTHKKVTDHPFFGMSSDTASKSVLDELDDLRSERIHDI